MENFQQDILNLYVYNVPMVKPWQITDSPTS